MDNKNIHRVCRECGCTMVHKCRLVQGQPKSRLECSQCGWVKPNHVGELEH